MKNGLDALKDSLDLIDDNPLVSSTYKQALKDYLFRMRPALTMPIPTIPDASPKAAPKRGRPKNPQSLKTRVKELRDTGMSWPKIAKVIKQETGFLRSPDSYRDMFRKKAGKIRN
jgi:hypothetical protein